MVRELSRRATKTKASEKSGAFLVILKIYKTISDSD